MSSPVETTESKSQSRRGFRIGPGFLVTAAFIGPGTVTAASTAGVTFGLELLWVVGLSTFAAIVLQEMAGRIGLVRREPLGQLLREATPWPVLRFALSALIFLAILFGNTAYQSGNLLGAVRGVDLLLGDRVFAHPALALLGLSVLAILAGALLISGSPRIVSRVLLGLVIVMSLLFLGIAIQVSPSPAEISRGLLPRIPDGGAATTLALFGTTIVPYNLFLYASLVRDKWPSSLLTRRAIFESRIDIVLAVGLGGLVTGAILVTGAAAGGSPEGFKFHQLPSQLSELVPPALARGVLGLGLLGAGLTSAVTAPLAASYAAAGIFGWPTDLSSKQNRVVLGVVLAAGWIVAAAGILWEVKPEVAIVLAQAANGLVLPVIAILLWWLVSSRTVLGDYVNGRTTQVLSLIVVASLSAIWLVSVGWKLWTRFFG